MLDGLTIRVMNSDDVPQCAALEAECFHDAWSEESLRSTIGGPAAFYIVAELDGELAGYCGTQIVLDEGEILRIAVFDRFRKCGIGSELLGFLLEEKKEVVQWFLDVREHNEPALGLYRKYGFCPIGKRKKYYHDPEEDAVLMQRVQEGSEPGAR